MALSGLGLFLLEACAGTAFLLLLFPPSVLGKGFFSLHGALAAIFGGLALLVRPAGLPHGMTVAATGLLAVYTLLAHCGLGVAGAAAAAGGSDLRGLEPRPRGPGGAARRRATPGRWSARWPGGSSSARCS